MIPFNLFKYIYFRDIIYIFCFSFAIAFIKFVINILDVFVQNIYGFMAKYRLVILLFNIICFVLSIVFIFKKIIFKKYEKIKVITNTNFINWKVVLHLYELRIINFCIISAIICFIFGNNLIIIIISELSTIIPDYFIANYILSKYVTVQSINNN